MTKTSKKRCHVSKTGKKGKMGGNGLAPCGEKKGKRDGEWENGKEALTVHRAPNGHWKKKKKKAACRCVHDVPHSRPQRF